MDASEASELSSSDAAWATLLGVVRAEYADAVEKTVERSQTMRSYRDVERDAIREAVRSNYEAVLNGLDERRLPDARDDVSVFDAAGETRARQGVDLAEMLALWRLGLEYLHELARRVAAAGPGREALRTWRSCAPSGAPYSRRIGAACGSPPATSPSSRSLLSNGVMLVLTCDSASRSSQVIPAAQTKQSRLLARSVAATAAVLRAGA